MFGMLVFITDIFTLALPEFAQQFSRKWEELRWSQKGLDATCRRYRWRRPLWLQYELEIT